MSMMSGAVTLREQVEEALERLSRLLMAHAVVSGGSEQEEADVAQTRETARFLGQVTAGWAQLPEEALPEGAAGFGSTVTVEDADHGTRESYTLMAGPMLDIDAGQVSLASPIGQALLGTRPGDVVTVQTPQRCRRLRIVGVRTLQDRLAEEVPTLPAA